MAWKAADPVVTETIQTSVRNTQVIPAVTCGDSSLSGGAGIRSTSGACHWHESGDRKPRLFPTGQGKLCFNFPIFTRRNLIYPHRQAATCPQVDMLVIFKYPCRRLSGSSLPVPCLLRPGNPLACIATRMALVAEGVWLPGNVMARRVFGCIF